MLLKCPCHCTYSVRYIYLSKTFVLNIRIHFLKAWDSWKMDMALLLVGIGNSFCTNISHPFWFPHIYCPGEPGRSKARHCRSACAQTAPADLEGPCATQNLLLSKAFPGSSQQWERLLLPGAAEPLVWHCLQEGGDQGVTSSALSTTCTVSAKAYDPCRYFQPSSLKNTDIACFQRNLRREASYLSGSTLQPQTSLFAVSKHYLTPPSLSRFPNPRDCIQRVVSPFCTDVFIFIFSCKGQARAPPQAAADWGLLPTQGALCTADPGPLEQANGDPQKCQ